MRGARYAVTALALLVAGCSSGGGNGGEGPEIPPHCKPMPPLGMGNSIFGGCGRPSLPEQVVELACETIGGGSAGITSAIPGGSLSSATSAIDGSLRTAASLEHAGSAAGVLVSSVRATAQPGVAFPAGSRPGVLVFDPAGISGAGGEVQLTINTYLGEDFSETADAPDYGTGVPGVGGYRYLSFEPTRPFDSVELLLTSQAPLALQVIEFCGDGGSDPDSANSTD